MMRTVMVQIKPNNPAVPYFRMNTAGSRAVRNTANFLIRNTMTGLSKSPEERTHNETEALHIVFTGIQKANRRSDVKAEELMKLAVSMVHKYGLSGLHDAAGRRALAKQGRCYRPPSRAALCRQSGAGQHGQDVMPKENTCPL